MDLDHCTTFLMYACCDLLTKSINMKRELKITIKNDHNHYALIEQVNNRENEINRGIFLDKDQYEQLRLHIVSKCLPTKYDLYRKWFDKNFFMDSDTTAEFKDELETGRSYLLDDIYEVYSELKANCC